jgi:dimethylhistidine N-methyltransferase
LPEYYPTRAELALLRRHAREIAQRFGTRAEVVEFGAGSSVKIRLLLEHLQAPAGFVPVDISGEHLERCATKLRRDFPGLVVSPVVADYTRGLQLPAAGGRRIGFWPGSSIGNFEPEAAVCLLRRMAGWLDGGPMLVGLDLVKDPARLHAAYNDAAGVTAQFNLNLLERARRELGAELDPQGFAHYAFWNPPQRRIEMHLQSRGEQSIAVLGERYRFEDGQTLHTENSYKYTRERFTALAASARLAVGGWWSDGDMALAWLQAS